jgi:hypothetical protein
MLSKEGQVLHDVTPKREEFYKQIYFAVSAQLLSGTAKTGRGAGGGVHRMKYLETLASYLPSIIVEDLLSRGDGHAHVNPQLSYHTRAQCTIAV